MHVEAWALTSSVPPVLSARMDDNTLRCKKVEVEFYKRFIRRRFARSLSARDLQLTGLGVGYYATMIAAHAVLFQVIFPAPPPSPAALTFVLRAVDMVRPARHATDFCASFLAMRLFVDAASLTQLASNCFCRGKNVRAFLSCLALLSSLVAHRRYAGSQHRVSTFFVVQLILSSTRFVNDGWLQRWWP